MRKSVGQRIPEKEIANFQFVKLNTKIEHRKTDRWPAPCAYSQRSFLSPKSKKSIAMTKEKAIFSVQWYCALIWGRLFEKTGRSLQFKGSELFAILQNSLFRVSYLPYLKLQRLFAVIHLSPPCNRISEKVDLFGVTNRQTIGIWFCVRKSCFVILGYVRKRH